MKPTIPLRKSLRWITLAFLFLSLLIAPSALLPQELTLPAEPQMLVRVEVPEAPGSLKNLGLPVYAALKDEAGWSYALVIATPTQLQRAGVSFQILDEYLPGTRYRLARERRTGARQEAASLARVLHDDGRRIIMRESPTLAGTLRELGLPSKLIGETPLSLLAPALDPLPEAFAPDARVSDMIGQVTQDAVNSYISGLSGKTPVLVKGSEYTIMTRSNYRETPLRKATQYVSEQLQKAGLRTAFQSWSAEDVTSRNVIGELRGITRPDEIVLVVAHLDSLPDRRISPGADDNASGSVALLVAADIMSRYSFQRTIRFVSTTGEELYLLGAEKYAKSVANQKIAAVLNVDCISWTATLTQKTSCLHTRIPGHPGSIGDLAIAKTFADVVENYGLTGTLAPKIEQDGEDASDHSPFWDLKALKPKGFAAIMATQDDIRHWNPNNHEASDTLDTLNLPYCTAQVKAALGTTAHLAGLLPQD